MSVSKAIAITKTLRWHHVGFAFLWATTFSALLYPQTATAEQMLVFKTLNLGFVLVTILAMAAFVRIQGKEQPRSGMAFVAGLLLALGAGLFYAGFYLGQPSLLVISLSGVLVGIASGMFFGFWQLFFTSEGASRTAIYIPLSAVASAVLCFAMQPLPLGATIACAVVVFPAFAAVSLRKALDEIESSEPDDGKKASLRTAVRDLWKPVFCVCSIGFVWKIVSNLLANPGSSTLIIVLAGFGAAALVIALIELFSEKGFEVLRSYQVLFPLITGAFLLPTVFGMQYAPVLSGMLMFGFEVVNLLLIVTCAVYANERSLPSIYVYALGMAPTFVAMLSGDLLGAHLSATFAYDLSFVVGILFTCVYVLSLTMFLVSWTKQRKRGRAEDAGYGEELGAFAEGGNDEAVAARPVGIRPEGGGRMANADSKGVRANAAAATSVGVELSAADFEEAWLAALFAKIDEMDLIDPLSHREREVAAQIVRGNSVATIAKKLFISENTVRGHAKNIYRKLGVHSKQQLVELFEN